MICAITLKIKVYCISNNLQMFVLVLFYTTCKKFSTYWDVQTENSELCKKSHIILICLVHKMDNYELLTCFVHSKTEISALQAHAALRDLQ
jgi:hypothetical protein